MKPTVPVLSKSPVHMGRPGDILRSFPTGRPNYFRIGEGKDLVLEAEPRPDLDVAAMVLVTDLNESLRQWQELPFEKAGGRRFRFRKRCERAGCYSFRIKFTPDGETWFWDSAPYAHLVVDPPLPQPLKMYTLINSASGHIGQWTRLLPEIRKTGCNVLHLLPVTAVGVSQSPYAAADLFAVDPAYVDPHQPGDGLAQFSRFTDAVASHGMALCIDLVFNHVAVDSAVVKAHPDWIQADEKEPDGFRRAGWSAGPVWHKWGNLVLFDFDHPNEAVRREIWAYMRDYGLFWAEFAARTHGIIRLDNLHGSNRRFMRYALRELRHRFPGLTIYAELFSDPATVAELVWDYGLNLLLGTPWEHHFVPQLRKYVEDLHKCFHQTPYILPITSHDSGSPAQEFGNVESTLPRYVISALMGCGSTGLVQGVEYGLLKKIGVVGLRSMPEGHDTAAHDFTPFIAKVNTILDRHRVFHTGGNLRFVDDGHDAIMAAHRFDPANKAEEFIVLANLDFVHPGQTLGLDLQRHFPNRTIRELKDMLSEKTFIPRHSRLDITLGPSASLVLKIQE